MFENFKISQVTLNVVDLEKMTHFYQDIIGLSLFHKNESQVLLGIKNTHQILIELIATTNSAKKIKHPVFITLLFCYQIVNL